MIFKDYKIKLGDFGVSFKWPENMKLTDECELMKGFTEKYSNQEFIEAC